MKFNLTTITFSSLVALALLVAPWALGGSAQAGGGRRGHHLEQLNLTDAQSAQIQTIRTDTRSQMRAVLTAEQRALLENSESGGRRAWRNLDLSDDQRSQLRSIREASHEQVSEVLTDEQLQQLEEMREAWGNRHGGRQHGGPGGPDGPGSDAQ